VNGVSPAANSPFFEDSGIWRDGKTSLGDFLLVIFLGNATLHPLGQCLFYFASQPAGLAAYYRASRNPYFSARHIRIWLRAYQSAP
jgi:hypothetical protein